MKKIIIGAALAAFMLCAPSAAAALTVPQYAWLHSLGTCESRNRANIKVLDSNHRYSYGELQFQMGTFITYAKLYKLPLQGIDIYDPGVQKELAGRMLSDGLYYHWKICSKKVIKKLGLYPA